MKVAAIGSIAFGLVLLFIASAHAQSPSSGTNVITPNTGTPVYTKNTEYDFEDDLVEGSFVRPAGDGQQVDRFVVTRGSPLRHPAIMPWPDNLD